MPFKRNIFFKTTRITVLFVFAASVISLAALAGWIFNIEALKSIRLGVELNSMKVNTALGILAAGFSLLLLTSSKRKSIAITSAFVVLMLGVVSLSEYLFNWNAHIDELIFKNKNTTADLSPGRMARVTTIGFVFLGISLLSFSFNKKKMQRIAEIFAIPVIVIFFIGLAGYIYNAPRLHSIVQYSSISLHSILVLLLMALAILFAKPETGFMSIFDEKTKAARVGTRQILYITGILLVAGWLCLVGYGAGLYDTQFGISIMIAAFVVSFFFINRSGIGNLNVAEKEKDRLYKSKQESEAFIRGILSSLSSCIAVIDESGIIITVNKAWEDFGRENGVTILARIAKGSNYFEVCKKAAESGDDIARQALEGIQSVLRKEIKIFELQYPCHSPNKQRWFLLRSMLFEDGKPMAVVAHVDITEIILAQQKLEISEGNLKQVMDNSAEMIWAMDRQHRLIIFNKAFHDEYKFFTGSPPTPGIIHYKAFGPDGEAFWKQKVDEVLAGIKVSFERFYDIGDLKKNIEVDLYPIRKDGAIEGVTCFVMDITARKKAEVALQKSETRLSEAQHIAHIGSWELDIENNILIWSDEIYRMFEIDPGKFGASYEAFLSVIHPEDREMVNEAYSGSVKNRTPYNIEHRLKFADGRIKYVQEQCETFYDENGNPVRSLGTVQDITERKKVEAEKEKLLTVLQKSLNEIYMFNPDTLKFEYVNEEALRNLGYSMGQMSTMTPLDIKPEYTMTMFRKLIAPMINKEKGKIIFETFHKRADSSLYPVEVHLQLVTYSGHSVFLAVILDITERKKAEQELTKSEIKYRQMIERNLAGIYQTTTGGKILNCNEAFASMLGYGSQKMLLNQDAAMLYFSDIDRNIFLSSLKKQGKIINQESILKSKEGKAVYVIESCFLQTDPVTGDEIIEGIMVDITERKIAEQKLKESRERYFSFFDQSADAIFIFDKTGHFLNVNNVASDMLGYTRRELKNMSVFDIVFKEDLVANPIRIDLLSAGESVIRQRIFKRKNGSPVDVEVHSKKLLDGTYLGVVRDVTERKKAEDNIRKSEKKFRDLLEATPDAMVIVTEKGKIIMANHQAENIFGYSKEELIDQTVEMLMPAGFRRNHGKHRNEYLANPKIRSMGTSLDLIALHKTGAEFPVEISLSPLMTEEGMFVSAAIRDITERKRAEKELEESYQSVRQLTEYLQNVREEERTSIAREIHDELGQQLTVMMMDLSWLDRKTSTENTAIKEKIYDLMELLKDTIKSVRKISTELRPSVLDDLGLAAAMEMHLNEFEKRSGIHTEFTALENELQLSTHVKNNLFRIFQESLTNVARHSGAKKVTVKLEMKNKRIVLIIKDNGKGFDERKIGAKKTLGVLGMKERANGIGGDYHISGKPGKGTTIFISVPMRK